MRNRPDRWRPLAALLVVLALSGCQASAPAGSPSPVGPSIPSSATSTGPAAAATQGPVATGSGAVFASGPFTAIAAGSDHTCVIAAGGVVECWGANESGQLGNGSFEPSPTAGPVAGLRGPAIALHAGPNYTCAVLAGGAVQCWGDDQVGQLGDGRTTNSPTPVVVVGLTSDVVSIDGNDVGSSLFFVACALVRGTLGSKETDSVQCWGNDAVAGITSPKPRPVPGLGGDLVTMAVGINEICALSRSGGVKCVGLAASLDYQAGVPKGLGSGVAAIDSGNANLCAIDDRGGLKCWGDNTMGELGTGSSTGFGDGSTVPLDVVGLSSGVRTVAVGPTGACAITDAGGLKCWGNNQFGMLGNGVSTSGQSAVPVDVVGLSSGVVGVAQGSSHGCAITDGGSKVKCWGSNDQSQIGPRLVTPLGLGVGWSLVPVDVVGL